MSEPVTGPEAESASLDRLFAMSIDLMCIASVDGTFRRVSPSFGRVLGHSLEEFLRRPFVEFIHPDDREATTQAVEQLVGGHASIDFHNRYQCADGSYRWIQWRSSLVSNDGLIYAVGRDVTHARRLSVLMRQTQRAARVGGWELEFETGRLYWTPETYRLTEVTP